MQKRELTPDEIAWQAEALADFVARGGSESRWFWSKDFSRHDRAAIIREARRRRMSGGRSDPFAGLRRAMTAARTSPRVLRPPAEPVAGPTGRGSA